MEQKPPRRYTKEERAQIFAECQQSLDRLQKSLDEYNASVARSEARKRNRKSSWLPFGLGALALWFWNT